MLIPPAWNMGILIVFYAIAPFLAKKKNYFIIILMALSVAFSVFVYLNGYPYEPWIYRSMPSEFVFFLLGILTYRFYKIIEAQNSKFIRYFSKINYIFVVLSILCYWFIPVPVKYKHLLFLGFLAVSVPFIFALSKNWKRDKHFGELSFPIYLSHSFIVTILNAVQVPAHWKGEFAVILSIITAFILNEFIVKKIEKIRHKQIKTIK